MSDIWTPPSALVKPEHRDRKEIRPFQKLALEAAKLGFSPGVHHDAAERTMQLRFLAVTDRAKAACRAAMDNPDADRLVVGVQYREGDNPLVALVACWEQGMNVLREAL